MQSPSSSPYSFGFTAGGLGLAYCQALAGLFGELGDWKAVRAAALERNVIKQNRKASKVRVEREFRQRLQTLTPEQLDLLGSGGNDAGRSLALLAAFKRYPVIFDFCVLSLRPKLQVFDPELRPSDMDNFLSEVEPTHPEISGLTDSTLAKIRQVLVRILSEGGILLVTDKPSVAPIPLIPDVARVIAADSPSLLMGFLLEDPELATFAQE